MYNIYKSIIYMLKCIISAEVLIASSNTMLKVIQSSKFSLCFFFDDYLTFNNFLH